MSESTNRLRLAMIKMEVNENKRKMIEEEIPIFTDDFFVKKAEVELRKVLGRK